ncbi:MAG: OsmC family protein [Anaerolineales bacterium]|nr:OsmC family protein [Anaerolineales bacterium]
MGKITTFYKGDMLFESKLGNHSILIDVPANMGGSDRAPTPPELFVASLGSCVGAFVAHYCNNAGIDTRDMSVDVSFDKVEDPTRLTNVKITVKMPHGACGRRKEALRRVAEHCPVHETINTIEGVEFELLGSEELQLQ